MGTLYCEPKYRGTKEYFLVKSELIQAAQLRGLVTYQRIAQLMGLPATGNHMQKETGHILGEISEDEVILERPMLSALAVSVKLKPSEGFFNIAREMGLLNETSKSGEESFWNGQREAVYREWARKF